MIKNWEYPDSSVLSADQIVSVLESCWCTEIAQRFSDLYKETCNEWDENEVRNLLLTFQKYAMNLLDACNLKELAEWCRIRLWSWTTTTEEEMPILQMILKRAAQ